MAALGEAVPVETRKGLVLFLRRGMWAWVRALAEAAPAQETARCRSVGSAAPGRHKQVVQVLAAIVLASNKGAAE